jgi:hypothetical protein
MLAAVLVASLLSCAPAVPASAAHVAASMPDSTLQATFDRGITFQQFVDAAVARREGWLRLQREAVVSPALVARARAVGGTWQLLVIARDGCGDSMNLVPYAARLADSVPTLTLRIVSMAEGEAVANTHRTQDGRTATPTFVLLNAQGADVGCLVELPAPLRQWTYTARKTVSSDSLHRYRDTFYAQDRGASLATELVELLEAAKAGTPRCDRQLTR